MLFNDKVSAYTLSNLKDSHNVEPKFPLHNLYSKINVIPVTIQKSDNKSRMVDVT